MRAMPPSVAAPPQRSKAYASGRYCESEPFPANGRCGSSHGNTYWKSTKTVRAKMTSTHRTRTHGEPGRRRQIHAYTCLAPPLSPPKVTVRTLSVTTDGYALNAPDESAENALPP